MFEAGLERLTALQRSGEEKLLVTPTLALRFAYLWPMASQTAALKWEDEGESESARLVRKEKSMG